MFVAFAIEYISFEWSFHSVMVQGLE